MNVTTASAARAHALRHRHQQARCIASTTAIVALVLSTIIAVLLVADIRGAAADGLAAATVVALSIGCFAAALYANLALLGHRFQGIAVLGATVTVVTAAHTLWMAWAFAHDPRAFADHGVLQGLAMLATFSLAIAAILIRYTTSVLSTHPLAPTSAESSTA